MTDIAGHGEGDDYWRGYFDFLDHVEPREPDSPNYMRGYREAEEELEMS
jgi:hypothetical protein